MTKEKEPFSQGLLGQALAEVNESGEGEGVVTEERAERVCGDLWWAKTEEKRPDSKSTWKSCPIAAVQPQLPLLSHSFRSIWSALPTSLATSPSPPCHWLSSPATTIPYHPFLAWVTPIHSSKPSPNVPSSGKASKICLDRELFALSSVLESTMKCIRDSR